MKLAPGFNDAIAGRLAIVGEGSSASPDDYVAVITAAATGGFVRIKFVKGIAEGVNIYHRLKGSAQWIFLARDTKSPYDDHIELSGVVGGAQHWEYQAYGVINDQQVGHPSNIVEAVIG